MDTFSDLWEWAKQENELSKYDMYISCNFIAINLKLNREMKGPLKWSGNFIL